VLGTADLVRDLVVDEPAQLSIVELEPVRDDVHARVIHPAARTLPSGMRVVDHVQRHAEGGRVERDQGLLRVRAAISEVNASQH
jgi:hypothetical protein